jgi:catalase
MTVDLCGPVLLWHYILHEKIAHFNRERTRGRVEPVKGTGAYGAVTVTHDRTADTRAKLCKQIGKQTWVLMRFSSVGGEGGADTGVPRTDLR